VARGRDVIARVGGRLRLVEQCALRLPNHLRRLDGMLHRFGEALHERERVDLFPELTQKATRAARLHAVRGFDF
jgi:hypothetical protein